MHHIYYMSIHNSYSLQKVSIVKFQYLKYLITDPFQLGFYSTWRQSHLDLSYWTSELHSMQYGDLCQLIAAYPL